MLIRFSKAFTRAKSQFRSWKKGRWIQIFSRSGVIPRKGVSRFGAKSLYPNNKMVHWLVDCPKELSIKERLGVKRACSDCVNNSKTAEELANCLLENLPSEAKFCLFVEDSNGILWAVSPHVLLVVSGIGRLKPDGDGFIYCETPAQDALAVFGDFENYESKVISTWAKKPSKNTVAALNRIFPENTCGLAANLSSHGLEDGAYIYASMRTW